MSDMDGSARNYVLTAFLEARTAVLEDLALGEWPQWTWTQQRAPEICEAASRHVHDAGYGVSAGRSDNTREGRNP
jgi:hypothetical protein